MFRRCKPNQARRAPLFTVTVLLVAGCGAPASLPTPSSSPTYSHEGAYETFGRPDVMAALGCRLSDFVNLPAFAGKTEAAALDALGDSLNPTHGQVIFEPWAGEAIPEGSQSGSVLVMDPSAHWYLVFEKEGHRGVMTAQVAYSKTERSFLAGYGPGCSSVRAVKTINAFQLYTHCGIRHVILNGVAYAANPVLDDGSGNPPAGWGNPYQAGQLTLFDDGTASFWSGGLTAEFVKSDASLSTLPGCD